MEELVAAGLSEDEAKATSPVRGTGCGACSDTGFKGRVAVYEVMELTEEIKDFVLNGATTIEIKREAIRGGMTTLRRSGLNMLMQNVTTLSEVFRVSAADHK